MRFVRRSRQQLLKQQPPRQLISQIHWVVSWLLLLFLLHIQVAMANNNTNETTLPLPLPLPQQCFVRAAQSSQEQQIVYKVGVLANRGYNNTYKFWNRTFSEYLTIAVRRHFVEPNVLFQVVPVHFNDAFDTIRKGQGIDFWFANGGILVCVETELKARSLVTLINRRRGGGGKMHSLDVFGGVIFTRRRDNDDDIDSIADIRNRIVAASSISASLGSGHMQFRQLNNQGVHHLQGPKQVLFTSNQNKIVEAVLDGRADVGFVRTDQLERYVDPTTGLPLNFSQLKIINLQTDAKGEAVFPFPRSTQLYPEWPFAVLSHVPEAIARAVQASLWEMSDHAAIAPHLVECYASRGCDNSTIEALRFACEQDCFHNLDSTVFKRWDTTPELALIAYHAFQDGKFAGFRSSLSYMGIRNMQEETSFLRYDDEAKAPRCMETTGFTDAVVCPEGFAKKSDQDILTGCEKLGLSCYGFECVCSPCEKITKQKFLLPVILPSSLVFVAAAVILFFNWKRQSKAAWKIPVDDVTIVDPPRILGQGTRGFVLLAEYKGTQVAVKRLESFRNKKPAKKLELHHSFKSFRQNSILVHPPSPSKSAESCDFFPTISVSKSHHSSDTIDLQSPVLLPESGSSPKDNTLPPFGFPGGQRHESITPPPSRRSSLNFGLRSGFCMKRHEADTNQQDTWMERHLPWQQKRRSGFPNDRRRDFEREIRYLSEMRHPCIISILGAVCHRSAPPLLVMEYMQLGSLYGLLHNKTIELEWEILLPMLRDISQGLRFLHASEFVHGDLKAVNVLVDSKMHAKISHFGESRGRKGCHTGTPFWLAPEVLRHDTSNTTASDVYAFGVLLYEITTRQDPYEDAHLDDLEILRQIADKDINKRLPIPSSCTPEIGELMKACFRSEPKNRPTAQDIDVRLKMIDSDNMAPMSIMQSIKGHRRFSNETSGADALLSQLFPNHVALALKEGRKVEPESHEFVTVFFSDIVGYTQIASELSPEKVSSLLDRLYTKFDKLVGIYNCFKVETVGDAYMIVTNIHETQKDHVRIMALYALDAVKIASQTPIDEDDLSKGYLSIRAGLHSGPVVAHVVGCRNPRYSIIGDTVNCASRMESNSMPGRILCTEESATVLISSSPDLNVVCRGTINVKGKGEMKTYWIRPLDKSPPDTTQSLRGPMHGTSSKSARDLKAAALSSSYGQSSSTPQLHSTASARFESPLAIP